jgi:hypothetical protein
LYFKKKKKNVAPRLQATTAVFIWQHHDHSATASVLELKFFGKQYYQTRVFSKVFTKEYCEGACLVKFSKVVF